MQQPASPHASPTDLHGLTRDELRALITSWDFSPVHAARLWNYLYYEAAGALDSDAMPDIPARLMERLQAETALTIPPVAHEARSTDGFTRKYLLSLADGKKIETVLMRFTGRVTACISSQAGCAMGCVFCATGQMGFSRHLAASEIVAQALHVRRILKAQGERLRNVVLMGMGEPLHNYDAVMRACEIMRDGSGLALGARRITLSTVGVVPGIMRMANEASPIHLAVSLHAATQAERRKLVPAAKRWPLDQLIDACRYYAEKLNRRIFFEWTLIDGKNDTEDHAHAVGRLLTGIQAQVNLIPLNPTAAYDGAPGHTSAAKKFQAVLAAYNLPSTIRQRRGIDIAAGCGQLAAMS
ncbi:23S rRNA (adenine2503-C2)-methyltransferase [Ereboglobus sp. PH5-5]|uniref:23S rRNA (adenine(2503)-C(2))-methyltransferase RlmN n=1 Tax=Ereboglobus sp. PH5-5 TaxID=2940529 RepID=UPI0024066237|nr:23S rRNA (adenine(2503)-C(2))-methyltransferase RlmN [Ereboglobus sp. PH5-5]MDF9831886.1 23S rRNA (adenine2503-C2)-methyltransferase [Ereboglobus sp. PH5-5]